MKVIRSDRVLWLAVLGNTYFFFVGALLQFNIFIYGQDVLHIRSTQGGFPAGGLWPSESAWAVLPRDISRAEKIEYGLIPLGSLGMTFLGLCLAIPDLSFRAVLLLLAALGFFGGFFHRSDQRSDPAPAAGRQEGRRHRRSETGFLSWA